MSGEELGKTYSEGDLIIEQGDVGNCMYVVQSGEVEVFRVEGGSELHLGTIGADDFFGEMAIIDHNVRCASVRAIDAVRVLTVDKRTFLMRLHEDPSLAFRVVQRMSRRIRELHAELARGGSGKGEGAQS